jgi:hypothetical protein
MSLLPVVVMKMSAVDDDVVERRDLVALHRGLQRADRVDLGDDDARALAPQRLGAALAHVAVAAHDGDLAADHHVGGPVDAVDERVPAAVLVVELRLGDRVVDVDGREQQRRRLLHLVQPVHAGRGLLGDALDARGDRRPALWVLGSCAAAAEDDLELLGVGRRRVGTLPAFSNSTPLCTSSVASPPSSRIMFGPVRRRASAAPARCTTSTPRASRPSRRTPGRRRVVGRCPSGPTAIAAAAWSWVEKMLQLAQRTSAPSATASRSARRSGSSCAASR